MNTKEILAKLRNQELTVDEAEKLLKLYGNAAVFRNAHRKPRSAYFFCVARGAKRAYAGGGEAAHTAQHGSRFRYAAKLPLRGKAAQIYAHIACKPYFVHHSSSVSPRRL